MDDKVRSRLQGIEQRFAEIEKLLCDPAVLADPRRMQELNKERSDASEVVEVFGRLRRVEADVADNRALLEDPDPEMRKMAKEEVVRLEGERAGLEERLKVLLTPRDPLDGKNIILEVRSGTGGEEAALFAAELLRLYTRYAELKRWKIEPMSLSSSSGGGIKEAIVSISGKDVYSHLRFESGVHRVQRVPVTEAQGRIHTSAATVAVLPEADEVDVRIEDKDLEIHVAAAGGPGGQGVNTTNSAVRLLHKPTGLMVHCMDERSQHKNKAKAMKILRSRLMELEIEKQQAERTAERRAMVRSGDRSEKIRTYNFPQDRITDHRLDRNFHNLPSFMNGEIDDLVEALRLQRQAELLEQGPK
ncbi:MAG: peptide chain release factor 1 [Deltaproteobacteria bacterium]|nr:peptide chain release factor 1 [Deltaproteobacteria bacterium]